MRIGVGLSIPELATRGGKFSPASLFSGGVQGAWYAPDDFSTLFQDSAGTTPVTAVEQPVGLMLDKSQGLVLGSELVTNGDFSGGSTGWTVGAGWSIGSGVATATSAANLVQAGILTIGKWYKVSIDVNTYAAGPLYAGTLANLKTLPTGTGTKTAYFLADATSFYIAGLGGFTGVIDNVSVKELPGNHASQATAASRPVLRARYNLLTYSEQFDNAVWTKNAILAFGSGSVVNATTSPDGTVTADLVVPNTVLTNHAIQIVSSLSAGVAYTASIYAKTAGYDKLVISDWNEGTRIATFDLTNVTATISGSGATVTLSNAVITAVGSGWYRCSVQITKSTSGSLAYYLNSSAAYAGDGTSGLYIWGAQLVTGSSAGTYQRIAAATDYATAGFLPYLYFVTDDSFGTNSIDFTATDKMSVCAGVTKLSDAATAVLAELSASSGVNTGVFAMFAPGSPASKRFGFNSNGNAGTIAEAATTDTAYNAPFTAVLTGQGDISGDSVTLRANATQVGSSTADQGAGNYGNWPLFIGRRNNASLPFNGNFYQLVVCGKTLSASELASTEAYVNSKTGAY